MADIALFMVEESEKLKRNEKKKTSTLQQQQQQQQGMKKQQEEEKAEGFNWLPSSPYLSAVQENMSLLKESAAVKEMVVLARRSLEPKSSFSLAVFDGFFSA